ncbi:MAG: GtrA family protein [Gammaproteobacteria bacterium]|nr:GtrA family protein [Gammaproteobacteria bacterium]
MRQKGRAPHKLLQPLAKPRSVGADLLGLFTRYAGAGAAGTGIHFLVLLLLDDYLGAVAASSLGALAGLVVNFHLARSLVFNGRQVGPGALRRFSAVACGGFAVNATMMATLTPAMSAFSAQIIATGTVFCAGFLLNNAWTFNEQRMQH